MCISCSFVNCNADQLLIARISEYISKKVSAADIESNIEIVNARDVEEHGSD